MENWVKVQVILTRETYELFKKKVRKIGAKMSPVISMLIEEYNKL